MNDKELNLRETERDGGEYDALLSLLRDAYPAPPPGFAGRVMERIRSGSGDDAKLLPAADSREAEKKAARRKLFVRWGALAACAVLVGTIGFRFLPAYLNKSVVQDRADGAYPETAATDANEAFDEAAMPAEEKSAVTSAYDDAEEAGGAEFFAASSMTSGAGADLPEARAAMPPSPEPEYPAEAEAEPEAVVEEEAAYDEAAPDGWFGMAYDADYEEDGAWSQEEAEMEGLLSMKLFTLNGMNGSLGVSEGEIPRMGAAARNDALSTRDEEQNALTYYYVRTACAHANTFRNSYHDIPEVLIAKVGPQLYGAWATKVQNEDLCGVNILSFAVRFGLTAEDIYETGDTWYLLDLPDGIPLTEENAAQIEQYYLEGGDPGKMIPRLTVYSLKTAMIREAGVSAYTDWRGDGSRTLRSWTVAEGASALGISDERLNALYDAAAEKVASEYGRERIPALEEILEGE